MLALSGSGTGIDGGVLGAITLGLISVGEGFEWLHRIGGVWGTILNIGVCAGDEMIGGSIDPTEAGGSFKIGNNFEG
jgi:hypothetical protein